ncbi:exonuclease mut-7 homolog isoform X2 [Mizuhopecten yessoensis]|uniref:exonuclease mut-7 homolog isoform X2 n=1 Tax=Mizuhopecten yessoensis TaxID=6573 RepID=UPI000B4586CE|nr:exonuclease mut-7 homolog isoform X2 [Mizuhopecten yessoensis]
MIVLVGAIWEICKCLYVSFFYRKTEERGTQTDEEEQRICRTLLKALKIEENETVKILKTTVKKRNTKSYLSSAQKRWISKHSMAQREVTNELSLVPGGAEGVDDESDHFYAAHFPPLHKDESDTKTKPGSSKTKETSFKQIHQQVPVSSTTQWMTANLDKAQRETTVDEMRQVLLELEDKWSDDTKKDKTDVYRTFRRHLSHCTNPYTLVTYLVEKSKDYHLPKTSTLAYYIMKEFDNWCSSKDNIPKYSQFLLTQELKLHVLHMCTRFHMTMVGFAIKAFQLNQPDNSFLVPVLRCFLEQRKYKEAAVCAGKLGLQDHFSVEETVLPLILQDKVNLIESYLVGNPQQQQLVVHMLDRLCDRSIDMSHVISSSGVPNAKREKMHWKPLSKLAARLMKLYEISPDLCPNISNARGLGAVKYLLYKRYIEGSMGAGSWEEMVQSAVGDSTFLKEQLIEQLMCYNETVAAAKWADHYQLSDESIPPPVAQQRKILKENPGPTTQEIGSEDWETDCYTDSDIKTSWYPLKMSLDAISMVDTKESYWTCLQRLSQPGTTVGIDSEWRPGFGNTVQRVALMQLAVLDHIFLLDVISLSQQLQEDDWQQFVACVFCNPAILKLGYGLDSDFQMFVKTFPFMKESLAHLCRVVELEKVARKVIDKTVNLLPETGQSDEEDAPVEDSDSGVNIKFPQKEARGLSELVRQTLGRPLSKTEQMSDWERRPLRPAQITYAALDAYVLLEVYDELISRAQKLKMNFDMELPVSMKWMKASKRDKMRARAKGQKFTYKDKSPKTNQYTSPPPRGAGPSQILSPGQLKVVVDSMLQGLGRQLRSCGVDVYILENHEDHDRTIEICKTQNRIVLTSGNPYIMVRSHVGEHMCYCVQSVTAREQVVEVMEHFGVKVKTEDIFSRCQVSEGV